MSKFDTQVNQGMDRAIRSWSERGLLHVTNEIKENLTGRVLKVRSGRLRDSILPNSRLTAKGGFFVGTNVVYGIAWEKGFTRKGYDIFPRTKKALRWFDKGGTKRFAASVKIPAQTFSPKPFIAPAIATSVIPLQTILREELEMEMARIPDLDFEIKMPL